MKRINDLVIGTQYYRAPLPPREDWEKDIRNIRKLGMNTVKLFPQWRWHERIRDKFFWDDLDELFALCEKHGLFVHVNVILDVAPDWLFRNGHGLKVDNQGRVMPPRADGARYIGGWEPCFDDPFVRKEAGRFLMAMVNRYRGSPMLNVWDIWNEPRSRPLGDCACEESRKRYREWLRAKYRTVEALNRFWGKAWTDWRDIRPPVALGDYAEMYLWRQWAMHSVADRVAWACRVARSADPNHPVMAHVGGCSPTQDVLQDTCDDWLTSRGLDFYGSSLVVDAIPSPALQRTMTGLHCDWLRCLSPYFWINEFYPNNAGWTDDIDPKELRLRFWSAIAHGAKGILFWQYRSERVGVESNGHGLVEVNGDANERTEEMRRALATLKEHGELLGRIQTIPAQAALLYDQRSDLMSRIESARGYGHGRPGEFPYFHTYKASLQGGYALFWENNFPVDFVSIHDLGRIHRYQLLYLPAPCIVGESAARCLVEFVRKGGTLVSETSIGLRAENTWVNPENPTGRLRNLFGAIEKHRAVVKQPRMIKFSRDPMRVPATRMRTILQPTQGQVWGRWVDGAVAATCNHFGKGRAILLGFYPGASYVDTADSRWIQWFRHVMPTAGLAASAHLTGAGPTVHARVVRSGRNRKIIFLFNHGNRNERVRVRVPSVSHYRMLAGAGRSGKSAAGVVVRLPPKAVVIVLGSSSD